MKNYFLFFHIDLLCCVIVIYHSDIGSYRQVIYFHLPDKLIYVHD